MHLQCLCLPSLLYLTLTCGSMYGMAETDCPELIFLLCFCTSLGTNTNTNCMALYYSPQWRFCWLSSDREKGMGQWALSVKGGQKRDLQGPDTLSFLWFCLWNECSRFALQLGTSVVVAKVLCVCPYFSVLLFKTSVVLHVYVCLCRILRGDPYHLNHSSDTNYQG